jgi:hypothetical protein
MGFCCTEALGQADHDLARDLGAAVQERRNSAEVMMYAFIGASPTVLNA